MIRGAILFRYVAVRFLIAILAVFALCMVLIFMIDFIELLRQSGKRGAVPVGQLVVMALLRLPAYAELTLPFAALTGTIGAFLMLSRSSELVVIRSAGMSVWQFAFPGIVIGLLLGLFANLVYNPMAADLRARSEALYAEAFGREESLLRTKAGAWLRQDGIDGSSIITASAATNQGMELTDVAVIQFDREHRFLERIDAGGATLKDGYWELRDAWVSRAGEPAERYGVYQVSTYLTPAQVTDALGKVISLSFWQLPGIIELAEKAGLKATPYRVQYQMLLTRPLLLAAMVLLGATVSLRAFRFGNIQTKVVAGLAAGFGFFILAEVSRQVGNAGLTPPVMAAWVPTAVAGLLSLTVLLHQEDG